MKVLAVIFRERSALDTSSRDLNRQILAGASQLTMSAIDAVDGSSTGTWVPRMWGC
jgi:hypothetical protein